MLILALRTPRVSKIPSRYPISYNVRNQPCNKTEYPVSEAQRLHLRCFLPEEVLLVHMYVLISYGLISSNMPFSHSTCCKNAENIASPQRLLASIQEQGQERKHHATAVSYCAYIITKSEDILPHRHLLFPY